MTDKLIERFEPIVVPAFDVEALGDTHEAEMAPHHLGHWVRYNDYADALEAQQKRIAELQETVVPFLLVHAARYSREHELPDGHLHYKHYDILKSCGARMDDFTRAALAREGEG